MRENDNIYLLRRRIYEFITEGEMGIGVLNELLPEGMPRAYEHQLWDYKLELPSLPVNRKPSEAEKENYNAKMAEIAKDAVSFYNSFGGYLIIGVCDNPREIVGISSTFDCDELNKKIMAATKHSVGCAYNTKEYSTSGKQVKIGILFIPKRPESIDPAQFLKDAPVTANGHKAYKKGDIYFRENHECKPASTSEEIGFLCSARRRQISPITDLSRAITISNNLTSRDPGFISFVGREQYLQTLWRWLCDRYSACKLLTGLGGVGKTTLSREFAEQVIANNAFGFERVIWLSAKRKLYTATLDQYISASRVDFFDTSSLLNALLLELAYPAEQIDTDWSKTEIVQEVIEALQILPSFIIIDDIDSLEPGQQSEVFHTILEITNRTTGHAIIPSRALLTARLELGAASGQLIRVTGLELNEFAEYVEITAKSLDLSLNLRRTDPLLKKFYTVTEGSPTFASSILRLLCTGTPLHKALDRWKGSDGEEVRRFAFQNELNKLTSSQIRTLYTACLLGETSNVELQQITSSNNTLLEDDLGVLRNYHLVAIGNDVLRGGASLIVPSGIRLMVDIIREHVKDPNRIERTCKRIRESVANLDNKIGEIVRRALALWQEGKNNAAFDLVNNENTFNPNNPDLKCLLGKAYLKLNPPDADNADSAFSKAYKYKCTRPELLSLWVEAKRLRGDWTGIDEISKLSFQWILPSEKICYYTEALNEFSRIAEASGSLIVALDYCRKAIENITTAFRKNQGKGRVIELNERLRICFHRYIRLTDRINAAESLHLNVWDATYYAFRSHVLNPDYVSLGIARLISWWRWVETRVKYNERKKVDVLKRQLEKLDFMIEVLDKPYVSNTHLIAEIRKGREILTKSLQAYTLRYRSQP